MKVANWFKLVTGKLIFNLDLEEGGSLSLGHTTTNNLETVE